MKKLSAISAILACLLISCSDSDSDSSPQDSQTCTIDFCKDNQTAVKCENGKPGASAVCTANQTCVQGACKDKTAQNPGTDTCTVDFCKDEQTAVKCENGKPGASTVCTANQSCVQGSCKDKTAQNPGTDACAVNFCDDQTAVKCENGKPGARESCINGQICEDGGCMDPFTIDAPCDHENAFGKCTGSGEHAIVCHDGRITRYTCRQPCQDGADGLVNCPKKSAEDEAKKDCIEREYKASCINGGANALVCVSGKVQTWTCYNNQCNVDSNNTVTCAREPTGTTGVEIGGTIGDACITDAYQETCVDKIYALTCDKGKVKMTACGSCHASGGIAACTGSSACPDSPYAWCIYNNQALAYCDGNSVIATTPCTECTEDKILECMKN